MSNLDRFIASKLTHAVTVTSSLAKSSYFISKQKEMYVDSEAPSLTIQGNGGGSLHIPPQLLDLSELEFKKAFLLLTYIHRHKRSGSAADRVGKIFVIADDRVQGAVFDLSEDIAKELLENEVPEGNSISLITKLPPPQDDGPSSDNYGRFSSRDRTPRGGGGSRGSRCGGRGGSSRGRDSWGGDDDRRSRSSGGGGSSWSRGGGGGSRGSSDDWLIGGGSDRRASSSRAPSRERLLGTPRTLAKSSSSPVSPMSQRKRREDKDICFVCFDGGSLAKLLKIKLLMVSKDYSAAISESGYILKEDENNLESPLLRGRAYYYLVDHDVAQRMIMESVSNHVVNNVACPVTIVKSHH
ncbi:hypothetical protein Bca101_021097 [Brassica carinata]